MIEDVRALLYLDGRLLANRVRLVLRSPRRLVPWLLVLLWIGSSRLARFVSRPGRASLAVYSGLMPVASLFVPGAYLILLGAGVSRAAVHAPAPFRSAADARFLIGSRLPPRMVVGWLQLRRTVGLMLVSLFNVLLIVAFLPLGGTSPPRLLALLVAIAGGYVTLQAVPMTAYFTSRRLPWLPVGKLGVAVAGIGGLSVTLGLAARVGWAVALPAWAGPLLAPPPGVWARDAYHGQVLPVLLMVALAASAVALTVRLSGDCYPELWESSSRHFTLRRLARARGGHLRQSDIRRAFGTLRSRGVASAPGRRVPGGAGAILGKEWLALRRAPASLALQLAFTAAAALVGVVAGVLLAGGELQLATSMGIVGVAGVFMLNLYLGLRLGPELRNPVWWLSAASLRERLLAWTVAGALRQMVPAYLGFGLAFAIAGDYGMVLAATVAVPVTTWALRLVALVAYALVPAGSDVRGPARLLRVLLFQLFVVPPAVALTVAVLASGSLAAGCAAAAVVVLGEGWLLLEAAAWLVQRNGLAYARAEAR